MNTLLRDRTTLKRLVESYGKQDVLNFVKHLNESSNITGIIIFDIDIENFINNYIQYWNENYTDENCVKPAEPITEELSLEEFINILNNKTFKGNPLKEINGKLAFDIFSTPNVYADVEYFSHVVWCPGFGLNSWRKSDIQLIHACEQFVDSESSNFINEFSDKNAAETFEEILIDIIS